MATTTKTYESKRVSPHSIEAEQSVIGSILLDKDSMNKALEFLSADGSDFYHDLHGQIFKEMVKISEKGMPIDLVTLADAFSDKKTLDPLGGLPYLAELLEQTPTAANIAWHIKIIKEKSLARKLIRTATEIASEGYENTSNIEELVDSAESSIFQVTQFRVTKSFHHIKDLVGDTFETIEKLYERKSHITGVPSGYTDLDRLTAGFQDSDLIIVAGRPGMGKTSFALNVAENVALQSKSPVAIFSLEMSKEQLVQRMLSSQARVNLQKLRSGYLSESDWGPLTTAVGKLYEAPIYIDDTPYQSAIELRAKARRWKKELGLRLIIIDYLQLMKGRTGVQSREQEISEISRSLKGLAKELNLPIIALSQLSRRTEQREGNRPQLSDLRESGAIEQDADVVMFVNRPSLYEKRSEMSIEEQNAAEIIVAKQRNGPTDDIPLTFINEYARFLNQTLTPHGDLEDIQEEWVED